MGYLVGSIDDRTPQLVVRGGNIIGHKSSDPVLAQYETVDAMIEDGWEVD